MGQQNTTHRQISHIEGDIQDVTEMFTTAKECCCFMDMYITMMGQVFNSLSYYKRRNALVTIMGDKKKMKDMV